MRGFVFLFPFFPGVYTLSLCFVEAGYTILHVSFLYLSCP